MLNGINHFIYLEILQGVLTKKERQFVKEYLDSLVFYDLKHGIVSYEKAAEINIKCRKKGIAIRSTIDLLIAQTAIENRLLLLHNDSDFDNMFKL